MNPVEPNSARPAPPDEKPITPVPERYIPVSRLDVKANVGAPADVSAPQNRPGDFTTELPESHSKPETSLKVDAPLAKGIRGAVNDPLIDPLTVALAATR